MRTQALKFYFEALDRLKRGCPEVVPKGTKITNDSVSLEAGRSKGSIKKSRVGFAELIAAIDAAAVEIVSPKLDDSERSRKIKKKVDDLRTDLDAALAREMSLVYEQLEVREKLQKLTGERVVPIRRRVEPVDGS